MRDSMSNACARSRAVRLLPMVLLTAFAALATLGALAAGAHAAPTVSKAVVSTAKNAKLGKTILVDLRGRTLYRLSAERNGRFICTTQCLSLWHPLVVARGTAPTGARFLGTVRRPDGRRQVTYRGGPLYTFTQDRKRGDVNGDGFRDVGVWHPASPSGSVSTGPAPGGGYPS